MEDQHRHNNWLPRKTRNNSELHSNEVAEPNLKVSKPLLALFMEHLNNLKRELRQRKALTVLQNVKSTRIMETHLRKPDLNQQVHIA